MPLSTAHHERAFRAPRSTIAIRRPDRRARALLGQLGRMALAWLFAGAILTLLIAAKTAAYLSHHPV